MIQSIKRAKSLITVAMESVHQVGVWQHTWQWTWSQVKFYIHDKLWKRHTEKASPNPTVKHIYYKHHSSMYHIRATSLITVPFELVLQVRVAPHRKLLWRGRHQVRSASARNSWSPAANSYSYVIASPELDNFSFKEIFSPLTLLLIWYG